MRFADNREVSDRFSTDKAVERKCVLPTIGKCPRSRQTNTSTDEKGRLWREAQAELWSSKKEEEEEAEEEEGVERNKEGNELMKKRTINKTYVPRANTTGRISHQAHKNLTPTTVDWNFSLSLPLMRQTLGPTYIFGLLVMI